MLNMDHGSPVDAHHGSTSDAVQSPPGDDSKHLRLASATADPSINMVEFEKDKIAGAIRTDFVLSAEIIVIALGTVAQQSFMMRVAVLVAIAMVMTVGVYGLVAAIIKLDDLGLALSRRTSSASKSVGRVILNLSPYLLRILSVAGTAAMFVVGGGILSHGLHSVHHLVEVASESVHAVPVLGGVLASLVSMLLDGLFGVLVGAVIVAIVIGCKRLIGAKAA